MSAAIYLLLLQRSSGVAVPSQFTIGLGDVVPAYEGISNVLGSYGGLASVIQGYEGIAGSLGNYGGLASLSPAYPNESNLGGLPIKTIFDYNPDIARDGSDVTAELNAVFSSAAAEHVLLFLPAGDYGVTGQLADLGSTDQFQLIGEGVGRTRILALSDISNALFHVEGTELNRQGRFFISGIEFNTDTGSDRDYQPFYFKYAGYSFLEHLLIRNVVNSALIAESWWDSKIFNCEFASGGTLDVPMVWFKDQLSSTQFVNNIEILISRFENLAGEGIRFGVGSRKNNVGNCKFDVCDQGIVFDTTKLLRVVTSNFTHCVRAGISGSSGAAVYLGAGNHFDGCGTYGFTGTADDTIITDNFFGYVQLNGTGNINLTGTGNTTTPNILKT